MPMDRSLYPADWDEIARAIKDEVNWHCEDCGRPCRMPGESDGDLIDRLVDTAWNSDLFEEVETEEFGVVPVPKLGRFTLTVAHLNHIPSDCRRENLSAKCAPCHCRYDLKAMAAKRRLKLERLGQMALDLGGVESA